MMKPNLNPCPFCGYRIERHVGTGGLVYYGCPVCKVLVSFRVHDQEESDRLWNMRKGGDLNENRL